MVLGSAERHMGDGQCLWTACGQLPGHMGSSVWAACGRRVGGVWAACGRPFR